MITLVFPLAGVLLLAEHAVAATSHEPSMRDVLDGTSPAPGLWLVGGPGVFLMSNGLDTPPGGNDAGGLLVVYAEHYRTRADWTAVAVATGRGDDIRIVLPLLETTGEQPVLHRELTDGAAVGAVDFVIGLGARRVYWHVPTPGASEVTR
jgi:hypothetical protein